MKILKPSLAALGLSAALAAGSASAAITLDENGVIFLEDDDIDFHFDSNLNPKVGGGQIVEGDVLVSVLEFNDANGDNIEATTGSELTGFQAGQIAGLVGDAFNLVAYEGGLQSILDAYGYSGDPIPQGGAGEGALAALWLGNPDLDIAADNVSSGTVSCDSLAECVAQATDGDLWQVDGFTGPDGAPADNEFWFAQGIPGATDTSIVLAADPALELASFNAGATVFFDGSGLGLGEGSGIECFPFCAPGGVVDVLVGGSIKGGDGLSAGLQADGAVATSDFDLTKTGAIPEPSTLALLAAGFIGMGAAAQRRRRRKD